MPRLTMAGRMGCGVPEPGVASTCCLCTWSGSHPLLLGKSLPKAAHPHPGCGGFVKSAGTSWGLPAHGAWGSLLLQHRAGPLGPGSWLPHLFGGEMGGAQRVDLLLLQRLGLHPSRPVLERWQGWMYLAPGSVTEDLFSTCSNKK